jgi:hypothetical protein
MRYQIEHFRAIDAPDSALGVEYVPTGKVEELEAISEDEAAALALADDTDAAELDAIDYDPSRHLYGFAGEDEAVRVTAV